MCELNLFRILIITFLAILIFISLYNYKTIKIFLCIKLFKLNFCTIFNKLLNYNFNFLKKLNFKNWKFLNNSIILIFSCIKLFNYKKSTKIKLNFNKKSKQIKL